MSRHFLCFTLYLISFLSLCAQNKKTEKQLDDLLAGQFSQLLPGCQVLVARQGEVIYKKAFGSANLELNVPLNTSMVFNLASITKQFTAVAILQLVEQGRLSLEDSLQKIVPDYPPSGYTITIENLLTHTSGIKDYMQLGWPGPFMERWDFSPRELIDSFKRFPLNFEPGTRFSYSNSGYYLLGYIIEKISGKRYQDYIRENILDPLGMTHSYFDSDGIIIPGRVSGYRKENAGFANVDYWSPTIEYAAGGLMSNVEDLLKWHNGIHSFRMIRKETLQKAFTSYHLKDGSASGYGYGWFLKTSNGIRSIEHQGGLPGFQTNEIYFPDDDVFIAILTNCGATKISDISIEIAGIVLNKPLQGDVHMDEKDLDRYCGTYRLSGDKREITILKEKGRLVAHISGTEKFQILFQSETKFQFKGLLGADGEFAIGNGGVIKFTIRQNGNYEWIKVK